MRPEGLRAGRRSGKVAGEDGVAIRAAPGSRGLIRSGHAQREGFVCPAPSQNTKATTARSRALPGAGIGSRAQASSLLAAQHADWLAGNPEQTRQSSAGVPPASSRGVPPGPLTHRLWAAGRRPNPQAPPIPAPTVPAAPNTQIPVTDHASRITHHVPLTSNPLIVKLNGSPPKPRNRLALPTPFRGSRIPRTVPKLCHNGTVEGHGLRRERGGMVGVWRGNGGGKGGTAISLAVSARGVSSVPFWHTFPC